MGVHETSKPLSFILTTGKKQYVEDLTIQKDTSLTVRSRGSPVFMFHFTPLQS